MITINHNVASRLQRICANLTVREIKPGFKKESQMLDTFPFKLSPTFLQQKSSSAAFGVAASSTPVLHKCLIILHEQLFCMNRLVWKHSLIHRWENTRTIFLKGCGNSQICRDNAIIIQINLFIQLEHSCEHLMHTGCWARSWEKTMNN